MSLTAQQFFYVTTDSGCNGGRWQTLSRLRSAGAPSAQLQIVLFVKLHSVSLIADVGFKDVATDSEQTPMPA